MTILDVLQSSYIFRQQIIIETIEIIICGGLIAVLVIRLNKKIRISSSRLKEIGQTVLAVLIMFIVYFTFFFPSIKKTYDLKNNGLEISGKTVQWINTNDSRIIEYSFILNGQTFKKTCDVVYSGQEIKGIVCPDGKYVVIYDINNPDNSIMDFKRPVK